MSMSYAEDFSADLARAANLNYRLAELLEQHGTKAFFKALTSACQGAAEAHDALRHWERAAKKMRGAEVLLGLVERHSAITLADACRVLADVELG